MVLKIYLRAMVPSIGIRYASNDTQMASLHIRSARDVQEIWKQILCYRTIDKQMLVI